MNCVTTPAGESAPTRLSRKIADGIVVATAAAAALDEDFNISASEELAVAEIARRCWLAVGNDPDELEFEHLPSFAVDVVRRWPSVEKAERLLGWRARIGVDEGLRQTAECLRRQEPSPAAASLVGSSDRRSTR